MTSSDQQEMAPRVTTNTQTNFPPCRKRRSHVFRWDLEAAHTALGSTACSADEHSLWVMSPSSSYHSEGPTGQRGQCEQVIENQKTWASEKEAPLAAWTGCPPSRS